MNNKELVKAAFDAMGKAYAPYSGYTVGAALLSKSGNVTDMFMPCGVCRQVMAEFCDDDFEIIVALTHDDFKSFTLKELLPFGFSKSNIK